jgi:hypothetical protein
VKLGAKIFGALAGILILYLLLGILLPGAWEARTEARLPASPETVFPYLNRPELWIRWNSVPETGLEMVGGATGEGAGFQWDDPQYGSGRFVIRQSRPSSFVQYEVLIEGGALRVAGTLELAPDGDQSILRWTEEGDFGWNPILGYAARGMADSQAQAMNASLETLRRLLEEEETKS